MSWHMWLKQINNAFEKGDWDAFDNLVEEYDYEFSDNEKAIDALDRFMNDPMVKMSLPAHWS